MQATPTFIAIVFAAITAAPHAFAQSFNIDLSVPTGLVADAPAPSFAGAANQPGYWNNIAGVVFTINDIILLDGATSSGVTVARTSTAGYWHNNASTTGDFELLYDDIHDLGPVGGATTYTFSNLAAGTYDVYTYAVAPDDPSFISSVTVAGVAQNVGGGAMPVNDHALGITYAKHTVSLCAGAPLTVHIATVEGFGSVNGFQIVQLDSNSPLCAAGEASPNIVQIGQSTLITVGVTPADVPPSSGIRVDADLSAIGGSTEQSLFDDGTNGDATPNDNIFSFLAPVPSSNPIGAFTLPFHVSDKQQRTFDGDIAVTVTLVVDYIEAEPNDNKSQATLISGIDNGRTIRGSSQSSSGSGLDYYLVKTAPAPPGIYRHRLQISTIGNAAHIASIRGLSQSGTIGIGGSPVPGTDTQFQTTLNDATGTLPARTSQWYGFGKQEEIYYRVTGSSTTPQDYFATLAIEPVTPTHIATEFQPGEITITTTGQGHASDTDFWVYDGNFHALAGYGNDDNSAAGGGPGTGVTGHLVRNYLPGTYYLALSNWQFANDQPAAADDRYVSGQLMDNPDCAANSSGEMNVNLTFAIFDSGGKSIQIAASKTSPFDVLWFKFTVAGEPMQGDINGDGHVDVDDLVAVILAWGACPAPPTTCPADIAPHPAGDGFVNVDDLVMIILNWG
jgi:hypothetical protein